MTSLVDQQVLFTVPSGYSLLNSADKLTIREVDCTTLFATTATIGTLIIGALAIDVITEATPGHGVWVDNVRVAEDTIVAPAMTLASISPVGAAVDISVGIIPKGTGAIVATFPDNGIVGGNARGFSAVDLQVNRTVATAVASGNQAVICGGSDNTAAGDVSFIGGGSGNTVTALATLGTIAGGSGNSVQALFGFIGGGSGGVVNGSYGVICGGLGNNMQGVRGFIGGGNGNNIGALATDSVLVGGTSNVVTGVEASLLGGQGSTASGLGAVVGGGFGHLASANYSGVFCGSGNTATAPGALTVGGINNDCTGQNSVVVGGNFCTCAATWSFIGGGDTNVLSAGTSCVIVGGVNNTGQGTATTIGGGDGNTIAALTVSSTIVGGRNNQLGDGVVVSNYSTILGGRDCVIRGNYCVTAGRAAQAIHNGAFVSADSSGVVLASTAVDQWTGRYANGFRMMGGAVILNDIGGIYSAGTVQTIGAVNGDLYTVAVGNNSAVIASVNIVGVDAATGDRAVMKGVVGAKNIGGVLTVGATFDYFDDVDGSLVGATFSFVGSGTDLVVRVLGSGAATINWRGVLSTCVSTW